jgi:hypothetical protein
VREREGVYTRCVYTWLIFASLLLRTSHGISYPYLYLNSAASARALVTAARASAIEPVITHPTLGERLKMYVTEEGSRSLSYF